MNDGGNAFPSPSHEHGDEIIPAVCGMSLRDYFAAQVLPAIGSDMYSNGADEIARRAYYVAEAMLAARDSTSRLSEPFEASAVSSSSSLVHQPSTLNSQPL